MPKRQTNKTAQDKLSEVAPHIELLEYIPGKRGKSLFFDNKRSVEFSYFFYPLIKAFKKNPNFIPCPSSNSLSEINKSRAEKIRGTCLNKYGVSNPRQIAGVNEKVRQTLQANFGVGHPSKSEEIQNKKIETYLKKYGVENPSQVDSVKHKKAVAFAKYKDGHPLKDPDVRLKQKETSIANGNTRVINGFTLSEIANNKALHYQTVSQNYRKYGDVVTAAKPNYTAIEQVVGQFLESKSVAFYKDKYLNCTNYKPDFLLPEHKLIIECDGLYWHSDAVKEKNYHLNKKKSYDNQGYRSLFFREDEIRDKFDIVSSMINNRLGSNKVVYARTTTFVKTNKDFFEKNHLMGKGAGKIFGLHDGSDVVAAIQVKWKSKANKVAEISRFCTKKNYTVVGGFSKLVNGVLKDFGCQELITFIDKRYGSGYYLKELGFVEHKTHLSFKWTDLNNTFHRMSFPSNSGYEYGLYKLWDCGQTKFVIYL